MESEEPQTESTPVVEEATSTTPEPQPDEVPSTGSQDAQDIAASATDDGIDPPPELVTVKERFLYAKKMQEQRERERLNQVKLNPKKTIETARMSVQDLNDPSIGSPASKEFQDKFLSGQAKSDSLWNEIVTKQKNETQSRFQMSRQSSLQAFSSHKAVTRRISQFEDVLIQPIGTNEENAAVWKVVKEHFHHFTSKDPATLNLEGSTLNDAATADNFNNVGKSTDGFVLGGTRVYAAKSFSLSLIAYLHKTFKDDDTQYLPLPSGVFADNGYKVPVKITSLAMKGASGTFYVAITIKPNPGHEEDKAIEGTRKIAVFNTMNVQDKLFERNFTFMFHRPAEGDEGAASFDLHDCTGQLDYSTFDPTAIPDHVIHEGDENESDDSDDDKYEIGAKGGGDDIGEDTEVVPFDATMETTTPAPTSTDEEVQAVTEEVERIELTEDVAAESTPYEEEEEEPDHSASNNHILLAAATVDEREMNGEANSPALLASTLVTKSTDFMESIKRSASPDSLSALRMDIRSVSSISSSGRCMVLNCQNSIANTVIVSNNLKATNLNSKCVAVNNQIYEWIRGVAISGWLNKFPTTRSYGRYTRRYFILRDNLLTYYQYKPIDHENFAPHDSKSDPKGGRDPNADDIQSAFSEGTFYIGGKAMVISDDTTVEEVSVLLQSCLLINTPSTNQSICVKHGGDKDAVWNKALKKTIELQRLKRSAHSSTIKTMWFHENPSYRLICTDVREGLDKKYLKAALYFCDAVTLPAKGAAPNTSPENTRYILDLISDDDQNKQLELMRANETPFVNIKIETVNIFGDYVLLGGSDGFIGLGTIGKTTDLSVGEQKHVLYVLPVKSGAPHENSASVKFFASAGNVVVAADNKRTLSLWTIDPARNGDESTSSSSMMLTSPSKKPTGFYYNIKAEFNSTFHLSQLDPQGKYANEVVLGLQFLQDQDKNHVIVSTSKRIVLLGLVHGGDHGEVSVVSYNQLDEVDEGQYGLFALNLYEVDEQPKEKGGRGGGLGGGAGGLGVSHSMIGHAAHTSHHQKSEVKGKNVKIIYWKITGSDGSTKPTDASAENICMAAKSEWSIEAMNEILANMRPL